MSLSRSIGSMVVEIAARMGRYKTDLNEAATATSDTAKKIEQSTGQAEAAVGRMGGSMGKTSKDAEKLSKAIDQQVSVLRVQADTFGMSSTKASIYKLAMDGATDAQLKQAKSALESVDAMRSGQELGEKIGNSIRNGVLAVAAGAAVAYAAFESLIGNISKYQDLAEQTGGDPAGLASLRTAADVGGASVESLVMASNRLQRSLASTDEESKGVGRALAAIGISVKDFKELRADEQIRSVAQAMNQYADGGEKVAVVQEILGKGAATLLPALKELGNETEASNRLTTEQIQLADDYKDSQARAKSELMQFAESLAVSALPVVTVFTGAMKDTVSELVGASSASTELGKNKSIQVFSEYGAIVLANLADIAYDVVGAFRFVGDNLGAMAAISVALAHGDLEGARAIGKASDEQNERILKGLGLAERVQARIDAMNAVASFGGMKSAEMDSWDESTGQKKLDFHAKETKAIKEKISEATKGFNLFNDLMATSVGVSANYTEEQAKLNAGLKGGTLSIEDYTKATQLLVNKQPYMVAASKAVEDQVKKEAKSYVDMGKAFEAWAEKSQKERERESDAIAKYTQSIDDQNALTQIELSLAGESSQTREVALGQYKVAIELKKQLAAIDALQGQGEAFSAEQDAMRARAINAAARADAGVQSKVFVDDWKKSVDQYGNIFQKGFVDMVSGGKDVWDSFTTSLATTFKTSVADQIYKTFAQPFVVKFVASMIGLAGTAADAVGMGGGAGSTLMSGISAASGAKSIYSWGSSLLGGGSQAASAYSLGGTGTGLGLNVGSTGMGLQAGGGVGLQASAPASTTAAGGTSAMTYAGWIAAAMVADSNLYDAGYKWNDKYAVADPSMYLADNMFKDLGMSGKTASILSGSSIMQAVGDKIVGLFTGPKPTETMGAAQGTYDASGKLLSSQAIDVGQSDAMIKTAAARANVLAQSYFTTAESLGIKAIGSTFGFNSNTGQSGENPNVDFRVNAGSASYKSGEISASDKAGTELAVSRALMTALQASELPKYLAGVFDSLTASTATQVQIDDAMKLATSYKTLHDQLQALPFEYLKDMSFAASKGLIAAAGTMENLGSLLGGYVDNFYSAEEKTALLTKNTAASFEKLGIVMPALDDSARAWYRSEVDRLGAMDMSIATNASAYASVLSLSGAMNTLVPAAKDAAKSIEDVAKASAAASLEILKANISTATKGGDAAMAALNRAVSAQRAAIEITRSLASEQVGSLQSVFDALKSNVQSLYGQVSSTASMQATQGNAFIEQALSAAQSTGYLPDSKGLSDAISASRSGIDSAVYASQVDADFARLVLAGKLSQLQDISGDQLTESQRALKLAEGQLSALDGVLEAAQSQLDALHGIDTSVLSVADAITGLSTAINSMIGIVVSMAQSGMLSAGDAAARVAGSGLAKDAWSSVNTPTGMQSIYASAGGAFGVLGGAGGADIYAKDNSKFTSAAAIDHINMRLAENNPELLYAEAVRAGISAATLDGLMGWSPGTSNTWAVENDLPKFSAGINSVPYDMDARIHKDERIFPAADNRELMQRLSSPQANNDALIAEIRALREEVKALKAPLERIDSSTSDHAQQFDRVTEGGNAMRGEIMKPVPVA